MVQKSKGILNPDRKLFIYSAHDTTVANMLMALGLFERHCPPYAATILIELRLNSKKQHVVTVSIRVNFEKLLKKHILNNNFVSTNQYSFLTSEMKRAPNFTLKYVLTLDFLEKKFQKISFEFFEFIYLFLIIHNPCLWVL